MRRAALLCAAVGCCLLVGCRLRGVGSAAPAPGWPEVHFLCVHWDEADRPGRATRPHGPALLLGDPPRLVGLQVPGLANVQPLGWSADGRSLAMMGTPAGAAPTLCVISGPGAAPQPVCPQAKVMATRQPYVFQWAPVGSRFALIDSLSHVFVGDAAGAARPVGLARWADSVMPGGETPPVLAWSDTGEQLAWPGVDNHLALLDLRGVPPLHEAQLAADRFVWAPGGRNLVTLTWDFSHRATRYALVRLPDGQQTEIAREGRITSSATETPFRWSPDGTRLALARGGYPFTELVLFNEDGDRVRAEKVQPGFWFFQWLADGSAVVCARQYAPLWLVPVGAGRPREAGPMSGSTHPVAGGLVECVTPDGTLAAFDLRTSRTTEFRGLPVCQDIRNGDIYLKHCVSIAAANPAGRQVLIDCRVGGDREPAPARLLRQRQFTGHSELYLGDLDTGQTRRLVVDLDGSGQQPIYLVIGECRWSPDGQFLLLTYDTPALGRGWAAINVASGKTTKLPIRDPSAQWVCGPRAAQGP